MPRHNKFDHRFVIWINLCNICYFRLFYVGYGWPRCALGNWVGACVTPTMHMPFVSFWPVLVLIVLCPEEIETSAHRVCAFACYAVASASKFLRAWIMAVMFCSFRICGMPMRRPDHFGKRSSSNNAIMHIFWCDFVEFYFPRPRVAYTQETVCFGATALVLRCVYDNLCESFFCFMVIYTLCGRGCIISLITMYAGKWVKVVNAFGRESNLNFGLAGSGRGEEPLYSLFQIFAKQNHRNCTPS